MTFDETIIRTDKIDKDDYTCDIGYDKVTDITFITTDIAEIHKSLKAYIKRNPDKLISAKRTVYANGENWDIKLKGMEFWRHN